MDRIIYVHGTYSGTKKFNGLSANMEASGLSNDDIVALRKLAGKPQIDDRIQMATATANALAGGAKGTKGAPGKGLKEKEGIRELPTEVQKKY